MNRKASEIIRAWHKDRKQAGCDCLARGALGQSVYINVTLFYACARGRDASPSNTHSKKVYDAHLSTLCWRSRVAFRQWKTVGSPRPGPLHDERKTCKKNIRVYLSHCQAQLQRKVILKRDQAFRFHHPKRFKTSFQKSSGTSLLINGSSTSDPPSVLYTNHFSNLGISHLSTNPSLLEISNTIPEVEIATLVEEERILNVSFLPEEVDAALNHLTRSSSAGPDSLSPQHLIYAGPLLKSWLGKVFDANVNLEAIPSQL